MAKDTPKKSLWRTRSASDRGINTRKSWWNAGHMIDYDDHELSHGNLGLGSRERKALSDENSKGWGGFISRTAIDKRIIDAVPAVKRAADGQTKALKAADNASAALKKAQRSGNKSAIARAQGQLRDADRKASRASAKLRSERRKAR